MVLVVLLSVSSKVVFPWTFVFTIWRKTFVDLSDVCVYILMAIKSTSKRESFGAFITFVRASMSIMVSTIVKKSVDPATGKGLNALDFFSGCKRFPAIFADVKSLKTHALSY